MQGRKVNDDITVAGQITPADLQDAADAGFRSVLNLRAPLEDGFLADEPQLAANAGLRYANIPVTKDALNDDLTTQVLSEIDSLPKPLLVHCAAGMRAGAMALMNVATRSRMSAKQAMEKAQAMGFDCNSEPELKAYFEHYVDSHQKQ